MNDNFKTILTFVLGAAAGSVATWYLLKTKYDKMVQDVVDDCNRELDEMEAYYAGTGDETVPEEDYEEDADYLEEALEEEDAQWDRVAEAAEYLRMPKPSIQEVAASRLNEEDDEMDDEPYVIAPEQSGDFEADGYEVETLTHYADGVVTDSWDNVIEDSEDLLGDFESGYGEYEDDAVYVVNPVVRTVYEILRDNRNFSDVVGK